MKLLFNKLIPDHVKKDILAHSYAKNLVGSALIASIATPVYALVYYYQNFYSGTMVIIVTGLIIIASILLLRPLGSVFLVREIIVTSFFICIAWLSYHSGGLSSATIFWFCMPPLLAIFYGGMRDGIFWSCASIAAVLSFFSMDYLSFSLPSSPVINPMLLQAFSLGGMILIILWLVYFFEKGKREASQEIELFNKKLYRAKEEAEQLAKKAEIANRLKSEFLANMSHELRTPLNGIIGFTELISSGKTGPISDEQKEYLTDVLTSAHHLLQLINDILDLTKIESGKMAFNPELINVYAICNEVKETLVPLMKRKHIQFNVEIDPSLRRIIIDPRKLKQIIYNFLSNAIKFTGEGGKIKIHIHSFDVNQFKIEVIDNGIGIREADLKKLFVEFQQLDAGPSKKYQGTGLGLALTQHLVEAQGGYVGVESKFGKGSTFYAILPCIPRDNI